VLVLDAEERCPPELAAEVRHHVGGLAPGARAAVGGTAFEAFAVPRRSTFDGQRLRGGRWRPDAPVRLFRRRLRFEEMPGADRLLTDGAAVGHLDTALVRNVDVTHEAVAERVARAARDWALQQFSRGQRVSALAAPSHAISAFLGAYVARGGWRDGRSGLGLAFLHATEVALRWSQLWALSRREDAGGGMARGGELRGVREVTPPPPRTPR
jgi:hypothetical protein